jgi:hypothetical protein
LRRLATGHNAPINRGKDFKSDEQAEMWLGVSESVTAIEMMKRKSRSRRLELGHLPERAKPLPGRLSESGGGGCLPSAFDLW